MCYRFDRANPVSEFWGRRRNGGDARVRSELRSDERLSLRVVRTDSCLHRILKSVKLPSYPQSTRFTVYTLLDSLMSRSRPALKRLGKEFVKGYCALAEGEKDPRNLMLSFSIVRVILVEFDVTDTIEVSSICAFDCPAVEMLIPRRRICSTSPSATFPLPSHHLQMILTASPARSSSSPCGEFRVAN